MIKTLRTIRSGPKFIANANSRLQIVCTVIRAPGQALEHLLVHQRTVFALPSGFAIAFSGHTDTVTGTAFIHTILWKSAQLRIMTMMRRYGFRGLCRAGVPSLQSSPFHPCWHWHTPVLQVPCPEQSATLQSDSGMSHSVPFQPSSQWHRPPPYFPWLEHKIGQTPSYNITIVIFENK